MRARTGQAHKLLLLILLALSFIAAALPAEERQQHFTEGLMECVFRIGNPNGGTVGTVMFVACPKDATIFYSTLITARHVLDSIEADSAKVLFRKKTTDGEYEIIPFSIEIRRDGKRLYAVHPDTSVDLAAMRCPAPESARGSFKAIAPSDFADEEDFEKFQLHPGDEVFFLGYPLGFSSPKGDFPIVRSGHVASYPILPIDRNPKILVDSEVHGGNSGGPVYLSYGLTSWRGRAINSSAKIIGIMSQKYGRPETIKSLDEVRLKVHDVGIGVFFNSHFVLELLDSLDCGR